MENQKKKYAVFTIDVECFSDTGCVAESHNNPETDMLDGLDEYIRILEQFDIKSTMFTVCSAAEASKESIAEYISHGHRLALHGYDHTAPLDMEEQEFYRRTRAAKEKLEEMFQVKVEGFRAPYFSLTDKQLNILENLNFKYDASYNGFPGANHAGKWDFSGFNRLANGAFKHGRFYEFGLVCKRIFGWIMPICGGGYFRLIYWPVLRPIIKRYLKNNDYYVFYLHPFELSRQKMPRMKGLKNHERYYLTQGIKRFPRRIVTIIEMLKKEGFQFVTFEELVDIMDKRDVVKA